DLFFVISGFIIMFVANKYTGLVQGIHFLGKRFWRINPIYYIATFLFLGVLVIIQMLGNNVSDFSSVNRFLNSLADAILILPISDDMQSFSPLLFVGWTLSF